MHCDLLKRFAIGVLGSHLFACVRLSPCFYSSFCNCTPPNSTVGQASRWSVHHNPHLNVSVSSIADKALKNEVYLFLISR
ncbi:hypothetical protein EDB19DRAFT_1664267, partial [Suillus lakei]